MTQFYLGVKQVEAWPEERQGKPGYAVKYPDGYLSWSPKQVFEKCYLPMGECSNGVTQSMVEDFLFSRLTQSEGKTTIVHAILRNGFEMVEASSCVDPANHSEEIGKEICTQRIHDRIWHLLGFVLQWARTGIRPSSTL